MVHRVLVAVIIRHATRQPCKLKWSKGMEIGGMNTSYKALPNNSMYLLNVPDNRAWIIGLQAELRELGLPYYAPPILP